MFNKDYFLNQLREGKNMDEIGNALADAMNEAQEAYVAELKIAEQNRAEVELRERKLAIAEDMVCLIQEYGELVCPEGCDVLQSYTEEDLEVMVGTLDEMFKMMKAMMELKNALTVPASKKPATRMSKSDDEVLANFIASLMG